MTRPLVSAAAGHVPTIATVTALVAFWAALHAARWARLSQYGSGFASGEGQVDRDADPPVRLMAKPVGDRDDRLPRLPVMILLSLAAVGAVTWSVLATLSADYDSMMVSGGLSFVLLVIVLVEYVDHVKRRPTLGSDEPSGSHLPGAAPQVASEQLWASTRPVGSIRDRSDRPRG